VIRHYLKFAMHACMQCAVHTALDTDIKWRLNLVQLHVTMHTLSGTITQSIMVIVTSISFLSPVHIVEMKMKQLYTACIYTHIIIL